MATRRSANKQQKRQAPQNGGKKKSATNRKDTILIVVLSVMILAVLAGGWFLIDSILHPDKGQLNPVLDNSPAPAATQASDVKEPENPDDANATFYTGVFVDDISLGGMTREEARQKITDAQKSKLSALDVTVKYGDKSSVFSVTPNMITSDVDEVLEQAMQIGRTGDEASRAEYIAELPNNPVKLSTTIKVDPSSLESKVRELAESLTQEPVDAQLIEFDANKPEEERFVFQDEQPGLKADADKLWEAVSKEITNREDGVVEVTFEETQPKITKASLQGQFSMITSFTTNLTRDNNRNNNVSLACSIINGKIMQPGDEFSFNGVVGKRTAERGFKEAGVIIGGDRTESGMGGGICQVSGTLFNAVAMADLEITQRFTHSYELGYLKRGRDATVDYGHKDFCFKNNKTSPIIIVMTTDLDKLTVTAQIYGEPLPNGEKIDIEVETTATIGANREVSYVSYSKQKPGTTTEVKARNGIRCTSYKVYKDANDKEVRRVKLFDDYYPPVAAKIYYNPNDGDPSKSPSPSPTLTPTPTPDVTPTQAPTDKPTDTPTEKPTEKPTEPDPTPEPPQPTPEPPQPTPEPPQPTPEPPQPTPEPPDPQPEDPGEGGE